MFCLNFNLVESPRKGSGGRPPAGPHGSAARQPVEIGMPKMPRSTYCVCARSTPFLRREAAFVRHATGSRAACRGPALVKISSSARPRGRGFDFKGPNPQCSYNSCTGLCQHERWRQSLVQFSIDPARGANQRGMYQTRRKAKIYIYIYIYIYIGRVLCGVRDGWHPRHTRPLRTYYYY